MVPLRAVDDQVSGPPQTSQPRQTLHVPTAAVPRRVLDAAPAIDLIDAVAKVTLHPAVQCWRCCYSDALLFQLAKAGEQKKMWPDYSHPLQVKDLAAKLQTTTVSADAVTVARREEREAAV